MDNFQKLKDIFECNGIFIDEDEYDDDLLLDSIQFVTLIVAIESKFTFSVDESYMLAGRLQTFNSFYKVIEENISI